MTMQLNSFSMKAADFLLQRYPQWSQYILPDPNNSRLLWVRIPCPTDPGQTLNIFTDDDEFTVEFDKFHAHFGWLEQSDEELFQEVSQFIDGLLHEDIVIAVRMKDSKWAGSTAGHPAQLKVGPHEWTYLRSWKGTFNQTAT